MESGHLYYIQIQIEHNLADNWIAIWTLFITQLEMEDLIEAQERMYRGLQQYRGQTSKMVIVFRPKYTGKYCITLCLFFGSDSSGDVRISLKLNNTYYNLNGGNGTYIVTANNINEFKNSITGTMIVDAVAGQDIKSIC